MDWIQFFGILVPLVAFFGFLYRELKDWRLETREETKGIREEIKNIREEIRQQAIRSDRLYEMFIDLLKDRRGRAEP
jgi:hypothetical protein